MNSRALLAVVLGLMSSMFFAFTFVFNRGLVAGGGHWEWAVILRYIFTLPFIALVLPWRGGLGALPREIRSAPTTWFTWSFVGFVMFAGPITWAANSGPSWLVAGSFQLTVLMGPLMAPFIYNDARARLAPRTLAIGLLIVIGVFALQWGYADGALSLMDWIAVGVVLIAAVAYPLGNRKLLLHLESSPHYLNATQRVFGMTLCSMPVWLLFALYAWVHIGPPTQDEILVGLGVAFFSGTIATVLFFGATDIVRNNPTALAAVEAMQSGELLFAALFGVWFLQEAWPLGWSALGAVAILIGIAISGWVSGKESAGDMEATRILRSEGNV